MAYKLIVLIYVKTMGNSLENIDVTDVGAKIYKRSIIFFSVDYSQIRL